MKRKKKRKRVLKVDSEGASPPSKGKLFHNLGGT